MIRANELLFWIPTHNDVHRLANALDSIRAIYPDARVVVYRDRDPLAELSRRVGAHFGAEVLQYEGDSHYGHWPRIQTLHRHWLEWFLVRSPCQWFLKFDTDSLMLRPFRALPAACVFGRLETTAWGVFPQGGCYGTDRATAERLLGNEPPSLQEAESTDDIYCESRFREDRFFGWLAHRANIPLRPCTEIASFWKSLPQRYRESAAVIHPVRDFHVGQELLDRISAA